MDGGATFSVRLIDSVGYMVNGAIGQFEGERGANGLAPWFDHDIPLTRQLRSASQSYLRAFHNQPCDHN